MRILYILPRLRANVLTNGYLRQYHFIRELSQRHAITLLALAHSKDAPEVRDAMAPYTSRILTFDSAETCRLPSARSRGGSAMFHKRIERSLQFRSAVREMKRAFLWLAQPEFHDLVLFHGKDTFPVIEECNALPIVADFCDATSTPFRQRMHYAGITEFPWRLLRYLEIRHKEKKLLRKTPHLAFISCRDRDAVLGPTSRCKVIPNGIDFGYWTRKSHKPDLNCVVYTGGMDSAPNVDGAFYLIDKILPLVRRSISNLKVLIVGRDPSPALMEKALRYPDITVTGFVDDMRPYLEQATLYVAPLRIASGMQNKLLEALAMEVPVVTTPVAAAGLRVEGGAEPPLLVADGELKFAEGIIRLLRHAGERSWLAAEGRCFVEDHFHWSHSAKMLEQMCLEAVAQGKQKHSEIGDGQ